MIATMPAMTKMTAISQRMNSMSGATRTCGRENGHALSDLRRRAAILIEHRLHRGDDATRHFGDRAIAVDGNEATVVIEPLEEWSGLVLEDIETPFDDVG